jgi:hypothetical protein
LKHLSLSLSLSDIYTHAVTTFRKLLECGNQFYDKRKTEKIGDLSKQENQKLIKDTTVERVIKYWRLLLPRAADSFNIYILEVELKKRREEKEPLCVRTCERERERIICHYLIQNLLVVSICC